MHTATFMTMTQLYHDYYAVLKIDPKDATTWFFEHRYITLDHCQSVLAETVPSVQALKLLTIVSNVDGGQLALASFAKERNYNVANSVPLPAGRKCDHIWDSFREMLKRWTRVECENIRHVWQQALEVLKLQDAYVHLTMLDVCGAKSKEVKPNDYSYLLGDETRIIIDADPGMGKTTYVSKLAYDWATGKEPQLQCFDQIFLITLRYISTDDLAIAIANLTELDEDLIRQCIRSVTLLQKTLVILDGYDELHTRQFPKIIDAINGEKFKHVKMLVTTRRSHTEKILNRPMWLRINGFKEKEQKTFVEIQLGASSSSMEHVVSLAPSFKQHLDAPLFLAITCAVVKSGETGIVETKKSLSGPSGLLNLMGAYHEILFKRAKRLKRCNCVDGVTNFQHLLAAVGWHAASKVFPGEEWVSNLHGYYDSIIKDLNFMNADDVLTAAKEMCLVWHRQQQMYPLCTHRTDEFMFLHMIFEEYLTAVFLANALNQDEELLSSIPELQATSPVSYFLSGMSNTYIRIRLQQAFSNQYCYIPWVAELPASLKDVAQPAACLNWTEIRIDSADVKLTIHVASQLPGFLIQARALLKVTLTHMEIDSDISPLFRSTIKELELNNIRFTGEPFAALQNSHSKQANNEAGRISFNERGVDAACKVNLKQLILKQISIYFDISCIFQTNIKHLEFCNIEISERSSEIMQKDPPARADCKTLILEQVSSVCDHSLCMKHMKGDFRCDDNDQDVLRLLFNYRFPSLKNLTLRGARIEPSRLAAFLLQCEQTGGIQCLSLLTITDADEIVRPNLFNGGNQLTRLRALETLILDEVSATCADRLFQLGADCIKSVDVCLYKMDHEQDVLRPLYSHRFPSLKNLTLEGGSIDASLLAAFLVHCEQTGGIQCLSLNNIKDADETVRPNLFDGGNQLTRLRALETLELNGVSTTCADTLFQLAVDCIKSVDVCLYEMDHEQDALRPLFSYRFPSLKDLTLEGGNIDASRLAAFLGQCEQTGGIQCLSLIDIKDTDEAVRPNLFDGGNQLTRLRALETLELNGVSTTSADTLFQSAVDCIKCLKVSLYEMDHEQDVLRPLFSYRFRSLKDLTLEGGSIEASRLAAFLVQCEQTGGIQCLSLIDIKDAAEAARLKLAQLPRLRALETLKLNDVGSDCAHVLFALAVNSMRCLEVEFGCFKDLQDAIFGINHLDTLCIECDEDVGNLTSCNFCPARLIVLKYFSGGVYICWPAEETEVLKKTILFLLNLRKFTGVEITAGVREAYNYITDLQGSWLTHNYKIVSRVDSDMITFAFSNMWRNAGISADKGNDVDDSVAQ